MRFEIDQPPRARDRRVIGRRLVQPDAEKIANASESAARHAMPGSESIPSK
jgi:hypothetical protein